MAGLCVVSSLIFCIMGLKVPKNTAGMHKIGGILHKRVVVRVYGWSGGEERESDDAVQLSAMSPGAARSRVLHRQALAGVSAQDSSGAPGRPGAPSPVCGGLHGLTLARGYGA
jgi:hypothetical protein